MFFPPPRRRPLMWEDAAMAYTVIAEAEDGPVATVASSVIDALMLARGLQKKDAIEVTIAAEDGWLLTIEELEELAKP
jgi:ribosomal protein L10